MNIWKMAFDYKKEYKEFYLPKQKPTLVTIPAINYIAVRGKGDPNQEEGEYQQAMHALYGIAYTIKMSKMGDHRIDGYFDYVVPPLEGLWWQEDQGQVLEGLDYGRKDIMCWISMIRLPDFVTPADFEWAKAEASAKKKQDFSAAEFLTLHEGLCAQVMHIGSFNDEPATIQMLESFIIQQGLKVDIDMKQRFHHEIYLSDPRKTAIEKMKTVIRYPVTK